MTSPLYSSLFLSSTFHTSMGVPSDPAPLIFSILRSNLSSSLATTPFIQYFRSILFHFFIIQQFLKIFLPKPLKLLCCGISTCYLLIFLSFTLLLFLHMAVICTLLFLCCVSGPSYITLCSSGLSIAIAPFLNYIRMYYYIFALLF